MFITYSEWEEIRTSARARISYPPHLKYISITMAAMLKSLIQVKARSVAQVATDEFAVKIPNTLLQYSHRRFYVVFYRVSQAFYEERVRRGQA